MGNIEFDFDVHADFDNTLEHSVGPTTSLVSRKLVDTNSSHYIFLNFTSGNDANSGFTEILAKKTFESAYSALTLLRGIIHITDSSIYTSTSSKIFPAATATASANAGIQAALGQTPVIEFSNSDGITLDAVAGGTKLLSGITLITGVNSAVDTTNAPSVTISKLGGLYVITDCYIYNKKINDSNSISVQKRDNPVIFMVADHFGSTSIDYNIFVSQFSSIPLTLSCSTVSMNFRYNIIYSLAPPVSGEVLADFNGEAYISRLVTFNEVNFTATLDPIFVPLTISEWVGYSLDIGTSKYYIKNNSTSVFYLENRFLGTQISGSGLTAIVSGLEREALIYFHPHSAGVFTGSVTQNIIVGRGHRSGIALAAEIAGSPTVTAEGNIVLNTDFGVILMDNSHISGPDFGIITGSENIFYSGTEYAYQNSSGDPILPDPGMSITSSTYSNSIIPLYFDQAAAITPVITYPYVDTDLGYVKNAYDFRLRQRGKKYYADSSPMILNSPLLDKYSGLDLNPWLEILTGPSIIYDSNIELNRHATTLTVVYSPGNPVELVDLNGNLKIDWNSWRKKFILTYDQQTYSSNESIWKLYQLLEDKGVKKMFPLGVGVNLMTSSSTGSLVSVGSQGEFIPLGRTSPLRPHHWKGFWITIESNIYYIYENDDTTLFLYDKLEEGYPLNDDYSFFIDQILVQNKPLDFNFSQQYFTNFECGGSWDEFGESETKAYEYGMLTIEFTEVENPIL